VILVDANVLIYAIDADSPHHRASRRWLESTLSGTTPVGLAWVVVLAFLRITSRAGLLKKPLSVESALAHVDSWLRQPYVQAVDPGPGHWPILRRILSTTGLAGNLCSDAHLAAMAIERGAAVCTTDHDFARFPGIEVVDPRR
jgi:uncharacterized protein